MKKKKYNFKSYADMHEEQEIEGRDGVKITVRNHIPYKEKEEMARDMAEHLLMVHDDSCVYLSDQYDKYEKLMIAKYYTNINTDDADVNGVVDFLINNDLYSKIEEYIWNDLVVVNEMFSYLEDSVTKTYEDDRCLTKAIRTSFGFLFTGEDVSESLAKAELTKDTMFNALSALNQKEKESKERMDGGKLQVGKNILDFSKKNE